MMHHPEEQREGSRIHTLSSSRCSLSLVSMGGRIVSLLNRDTGREWLWAPSGSPAEYWKDHGGEVPLRPMIGVDECIPTIAACSLRGTDYADHGDVWTREWTVEEGELGSQAVDAQVEMPAFGLHLRRRAVIQDDGVRLEYALRNDGTAAQPFLWALHPLLRWDVGDSIELSPAVKQVIVAAYHSKTIPPGTVVPWPSPRSDLALDQGRFEADGRGFAKLFVGPESGGMAAIVRGATAEKLVFRWNTAETPWLGIWICSGGRKGYWHVALEPTTSPHDSLDEAWRAGSASWIAAETERKWSVSLSMVTPSRSLSFSSLNDCNSIDRRTL